MQVVIKKICQNPILDKQKDRGVVFDVMLFRKKSNIMQISAEKVMAPIPIPNFGRTLV
jgi:hypothetical protein